MDVRVLPPRPMVIGDGESGTSGVFDNSGRFHRIGIDGSVKTFGAAGIVATTVNLSPFCPASLGSNSPELPQRDFRLVANNPRTAQSSGGSYEHQRAWAQSMAEYGHFDALR